MSQLGVCKKKYPSVWSVLPLANDVTCRMRVARHSIPAIVEETRKMAADTSASARSVGPPGGDDDDKRSSGSGAQAATAAVAKDDRKLQNATVKTRAVPVAVAGVAACGRAFGSANKDELACGRLIIDDEASNVRVDVDCGETGATVDELKLGNIHIRSLTIRGKKKG
jgi:hypothetical protein